MDPDHRVIRRADCISGTSDPIFIKTSIGGQAIWQGFQICDRLYHNVYISMENQFWDYGAIW